MMKEGLVSVISERLAREMAEIKFGKLSLTENPHLYKMDEEQIGLPYILIDEVQDFIEEKATNIRKQLKQLL